MREKRNSYIVLVGKPAGKGHSRRPSIRWECNAKKDIKYEGWVLYCISK